MHELVIFDCDGVLVDSEVISNEVLARMLTREGLPTTLRESRRTYQGLLLTDIRSRAEAKLGRSLPPGWLAEYGHERAEAFRHGLEPVAGAGYAADRAPADPSFSLRSVVCSYCPDRGSGQASAPSITALELSHVTMCPQCGQVRWWRAEEVGRCGVSGWSWRALSGAGSRRTPTRPESGRWARSRSVRNAHPRRRSLRSVWVDLISEKHARRLQDLVRSTQLQWILPRSRHNRRLSSPARRTKPRNKPPSNSAWLRQQLSVALDANTLIVLTRWGELGVLRGSPSPA
jgi:hypothetical protein